MVLAGSALPNAPFRSFGHTFSLSKDFLKIPVEAGTLTKDLRAAWTAASLLAMMKGRCRGFDMLPLRDRLLSGACLPARYLGTVDHPQVHITERVNHGDDFRVCGSYKDVFNWRGVSIFELIELPAKLLDYFLCSNKCNNNSKLCIWRQRTKLSLPFSHASRRLSAESGSSANPHKRAFRLIEIIC